MIYFIKRRLYSLYIRNETRFYLLRQRRSISPNIVDYRFRLFEAVTQ